MSLLHSRPVVPPDYYHTEAWTNAKARKTSVSRSLLGRINGGKRCRVHMPMPAVLAPMIWQVIRWGVPWRVGLLATGFLLLSGLHGRELDAHHLTYRRIGQERPSDLMWLCPSHHKRCERHIRRAVLNRRAATWAFVLRTWLLRFVIALVLAQAVVWMVWLYTPVP